MYTTLFQPTSQVNQDEVAWHDQYTEGKLERLVSNGLYPPAIHCIVMYQYPPDFNVTSDVLNIKMTGTDKLQASFPIKVYSAKSKYTFYIIQV